jgi:hypothetical protein
VHHHANDWLLTVYSKSLITDLADLTVSVYNAKKQLIEDTRELHRPVQAKHADDGSLAVIELYWGATWHMHTPLENLEPGSYLVIGFHPAIIASSGKASSSFSTQATYPIDTDSIDTGLQTLQLSVAVEDAGGKNARQLNPIAASSERSSLAAELIISTRDREVDVLSIFS